MGERTTASFKTECYCRVDTVIHRAAENQSAQLWSVCLRHLSALNQTSVTNRPLPVVPRHLRWGAADAEIKVPLLNSGAIRACLCIIVRKVRM